jgi:hypothetical protein
LGALVPEPARSEEDDDALGAHLLDGPLYVAASMLCLRLLL